MIVRFDSARVRILSGEITQMTARVEGKVYQISRVVPEEHETCRAQIEECMFLDLAREIYTKEMKP